jgi:hypothetical protein
MLKARQRVLQESMSNQIGGPRLHLGSQQPGRRIGLTKKDHKFAHVHTNASSSGASNAIPREAAVKTGQKFVRLDLEEDDDDDINRPPHSSDDEEDSADIKSTEWDKTPEESKAETDHSQLRRLSPKATGARRPATKYGRNIRVPRTQRRPLSSQASSVSSEGSKRKIQVEDEVVDIGAGHQQAVGFTGESKVKRVKTKATYSSSQKAVESSRQNRSTGNVLYVTVYVRKSNPHSLIAAPGV